MKIYFKSAQITSSVVQIFLGEAAFLNYLTSLKLWDHQKQTVSPENEKNLTFYRQNNFKNKGFHHSERSACPMLNTVNPQNWRRITTAENPFIFFISWSKTYIEALFIYSVIFPGILSPWHTCIWTIKKHGGIVKRCGFLTK